MDNDAPDTPVRRSTSRRQQIAVVVPLAVIAGLVAWLVLRNDSSPIGTAVGTTPTTSTSSTTPATQFSKPIAATVAQLAVAATTAGHAFYWAGPRQGYTYELTTTTNGRAYIRYLPPGVSAGDRRATFLTVATYPISDAYAVTLSASRAKGWHRFEVKGGGVGGWSDSNPRTVYVAFKGSDYQIEIYDPSHELALRTAKSQILSIG